MPASFLLALIVPGPPHTVPLIPAGAPGELPSGPPTEPVPPGLSSGARAGLEPQDTKLDIEAQEPRQPVHPCRGHREPPGSGMLISQGVETKQNHNLKHTPGLKLAVGAVYAQHPGALSPRGWGCPSTCVGQETCGLRTAPPGSTPTARPTNRHTCLS